jgi:hypothetical protein
MFHWLTRSLLQCQESSLFRRESLARKSMKGLHIFFCKMLVLFLDEQILMDGILFLKKCFWNSNNFIIISIWCCSRNKYIFPCENWNARICVDDPPCDMHCAVCQAHWLLFATVLITVTVVHLLIHDTKQNFNVLFLRYDTVNFSVAISMCR